MHCHVLQAKQTIPVILHCFVFAGVYISKYADCLHPRPWYHGKSGFIVICKLIKVKCMSPFKWNSFWKSLYNAGSF